MNAPDDSFNFLMTILNYHIETIFLQVVPYKSSTWEWILGISKVNFQLLTFDYIVGSLAVVASGCSSVVIEVGSSQVV